MVSAELYPVLSFYSSSLSLISEHFPRVVGTSLGRKISKSVEDYLYERVVLSQVFSDQGGKQFLVDVQKGWIQENGTMMQRVLDAGRLLSLSGDAFDDMVNSAWAASGAAPLTEQLRKHGIEQLVEPKAIQRVIRRRPECWKVQ